MCSSASEVVDLSRLLVDILILKIDEPIAEKSARLGNNISFLVKLITTLDPTTKLIEDKPIELRKKLYKGVLAFINGDVKNYNKLTIVKNIEEISNRLDIIILIQATMDKLKLHLNNEKKKRFYQVYNWRWN